MRELQQILERAGFIAGGGLPINSFNFFAQWGERATAYVQPALGRVAVPGWENADVAFGKDVPRDMIFEAEALLRKYYKFRYFASVNVGGRRYWIMTLRRASAVYGFATGGSAPTPPQPTSDEWLWFKMPDGGTVTLTKTGSPEVVTLEYSLDNGSTWTEWVEESNVRTQVLTAGQVMHVRNTSETSTMFNTPSNVDYYSFGANSRTYSGGNTNSLLCKNPENAIITIGCFWSLFYNFTNLISGPLLPAEVIDDYCYCSMFQGCINLETFQDEFNLPAKELKTWCYSGMFYDCNKLHLDRPLIIFAETRKSYCCNSMFYNCHLFDKLEVRFLSYPSSNSNQTMYWLYGVSENGDFYCYSDLVIPENNRGIPSGWIRHNI